MVRTETITLRLWIKKSIYFMKLGLTTDPSIKYGPKTLVYRSYKLCGQRKVFIRIIQFRHIKTFWRNMFACSRKCNCGISLNFGHFSFLIVNFNCNRTNVLLNTTDCGMLFRVCSDTSDSLLGLKSQQNLAQIWRFMGCIKHLTPSVKMLMTEWKMELPDQVWNSIIINWTQSTGCI